jgi:hypothetical protein
MRVCMCSEPCQKGFDALAPLAVIGAIAVLALFIYKRVQHQKAESSAQAAGNDAGIDESLSLVLWFLQVSATLQTSTQVGGASHARVTCGLNAG